MLFESIIVLRFLKFCAVGFSGMILDYSVTWLLKEKLRINAYLANSCGFVLAASSNYLLNRLWTFESHNRQIAGEYASFFVIALIGLGLNNLVVWCGFRRYPATVSVIPRHESGFPSIGKD